MSWTFYPFSTLPAPCSIVWCRFPFEEQPNVPAQKPRPGIVKRANSDQLGNPWVHVSYGTTQKVYLRGLEHFTISNVAEMDQCGLWRATRFRLDRVALIPWAEEFFPHAPSRASPVMGRLSEHSVALLRHQSTLYQRFEQQRQGSLGI